MSLTPFPFYYAFLAPLSLVVGINIFIYVLVGITVRCYSHTKGGGSGGLLSLPCLAASGTVHDEGFS